MIVSLFCIAARGKGVSGCVFLGGSWLGRLKRAIPCPVFGFRVLKEMAYVELVGNGSASLALKKLGCT